MVKGLGISKEDILDTALLFGGFQPTFTVRDFTAFLQTQAHGAQEEQIDELLSEFAEAGQLRRVGPGVYAKAGGHD